MIVAGSIAVALVAIALPLAHRARVLRRIRPARAHLPMQRILLGAAGGCVLAGVPGLVVGAAAAGFAAPLAAARTQRARNDRLGEQIPEVARAIASGLRAGRNLPQALAGAAVDVAEPARGLLERVVEQLGVGVPIEQAIEHFGRAAGTREATLLADGLIVGRAAGARLPEALDALSGSIAERARIARDRRAAAAQARFSAFIVGGMPLAFYAILGSGAREQVRVLIGDPVGWSLLAAGLLLELAGALWMRRLLRA